MSKRKAATFEIVDIKDPFSDEAKINNVSNQQDALAATKKVEIKSKLERLTNEVVTLRQEVSELKDTVASVVRQNQAIISLIEEQQVMISGISKASAKGSFLQTERFPVRTQEDLDALEAEIDETNHDKLVSAVQALLTPGGLVKHLASVLSMEVCLDYNVDGVLNKKRLQDYPKLLDIMYKATMKPGWTQRLFLEDLRRALRQTKNRHFKHQCVLRKKAREASERLVELASEDIAELEEEEDDADEEDFKDF